MSETLSSSINVSRMPAVVQTTTKPMAKKPATNGSNSQHTETTIIQSTSELLELSTGPNAQVVHEDAAYAGVPLDNSDDDMIQKLPKRKRTGNGWTRAKKASKITAAERSAIPPAAAAPAEVDPSKEEWAANLRRVVFQPSTISAKPIATAQKPPVGDLTQSPAHVMYFPTTALVDSGKGFQNYNSN